MMKRILYLHEVQKRYVSSIILRSDMTSQFTVGRSLDNTLVIEDINVSKHHCILLSEDNHSWYIEDLSTNGTWINDYKLQKQNQYLLENGDLVVLTKDIKLKFQVVDKDRVIMQPLDNEIPPISEVDYAQKEFQCGFCAEMFIKAMTLSCSHTFCKYCIAKWHENNSQCPQCAAPIVLKTATLVLDNYINALVENSNKELHEYRINLDKQREAPVSQPTTDDNMEVDDIDETEFLINNVVDYDAAHRYYCRKYGRCYLCNQKGYGTTGCNFKHP